MALIRVENLTFPTIPITIKYLITQAFRLIPIGNWVSSVEMDEEKLHF